jgi:hypothetical protein
MKIKNNHQVPIEDTVGDKPFRIEPWAEAELPEGQARELLSRHPQLLVTDDVGQHTPSGGEGKASAAEVAAPEAPPTGWFKG